MARVENAGQGTCTDEPVLQGVSHAGRRLSAIANHPPPAVGRSREIDRETVQMNAAERFDAEAGSQEVGIAKDHLRWNLPLLQQALLSVHIGDNRVEQTCTLSDCSFDPRCVGLPQP